MESGRFQIGVASDDPPPSPHDLEMIRTAGLTSITDIRTVTWPLSELERVLDEVGDEMYRVISGTRPAAVIQVGMRVEVNAVVITVPSEPLPAPQLELVRRAVETYGSRLLLEQGEGDGYAERSPLVHDPELRRRLADRDRSAEQSHDSSARARARGRATPVVSRMSRTVENEADHVVVDGANVVGSRPDGWWRDRPAAARRLAGRLVAALTETPDRLADAVGAGPGAHVHLVLEGRAARAPDLPTHPSLSVVHAPADGDSAIVALTGELGGVGVVVVTADRGLRAQVLDIGAAIAGPTALLDVLPQF